MAATHFLTLSLLTFSLYLSLLPSTTHSLITFKTPLNFITPISFSSHFSFSISPNSTLSLLLFPKTFPHLDSKLFFVEFSSHSIRIGENTGGFDPGSRQNVKYSTGSIGIGENTTFFDLGNRQKVKFSAGSIKNGENTTFFYLGNRKNVDYSVGSIKTEEKTINFDLGNRQIYEAFVNYSAGSRVIEVSLGKGSVLFYPIDLRKMWGNDEVLLGLESSSNTSVVYKWKLTTRVVPKGLHSIPVDPRARVRVRSKNAPCYVTVLLAVMIAIGCCAFVVFMVMFFKVNFTDWDEVMEMEYVLKPVGKGYEKVGVDVENNVYGNVKC